MITYEKLMEIRSSIKKTLEAKGATNVDGSIEFRIEEDRQRIAVYWGIEGHENGFSAHCYNAGEPINLEDFFSRLEESPSVADVKVKRMLEAIKLVRESAAEVGIELPEGWENPLIALSDKIRLNILENKRNGD